MSSFLQDLPAQLVPPYPTGGLEGVFSACLVVCFGYGGHMSLVFPGLLGVMKRPSEYKSALSIAFSMKTWAFMIFPGIFFFAFGADTRPNFLHNMPKSDLTALATILMTSQIALMFALVLNPVFYLLEVALGIEYQVRSRDARDTRHFSIRPPPPGLLRLPSLAP